MHNHSVKPFKKSRNQKLCYWDTFYQVSGGLIGGVFLKLSVHIQKTMPLLRYYILCCLLESWYYWLVIFYWVVLCIFLSVLYTCSACKQFGTKLFDYFCSDVSKPYSFLRSRPKLISFSFCCIVFLRKLT